MDFKNFLEEKNHLVLEKKIQITKRFQDGIFWKIKGITEKEFRENYQKEEDFWCQLCVASVIYPNLEDVALWEEYGVSDANMLLKNMLYPMEYQYLIQEVKEINGFQKRKKDWKEEAKKPFGRV